MIKGIHGLFYSDKPDELRAFLRDKLGLSFTDVGSGWLIFDFEEGDLGVHPTEGRPQSGSHDISFFTDDLEGTVADLKRRGVTFDDGIAARSYGLVTHFTMPGGVNVQLYQPRYQKRSAPKRVRAKKQKPIRAKKRVSARRSRPAPKRRAGSRK